MQSYYKLQNQIAIKTLHILTIPLISLFLFNSCSNDDDDDNCNQELEETLALDMLYGKNINTISGTICCVIGSDTAIPGDTLTYQYESNRNNTVFNWEIVSGSITIISGQNSAIVNIKFGDNFTNGVVRCIGDGDQQCGESFIISQE